MIQNAAIDAEQPVEYPIPSVVGFYVRPSATSQVAQVSCHQLDSCLRQSLGVAGFECGPGAGSGDGFCHPTSVSGEYRSTAGQRLQSGKSEGLQRAGGDIQIGGGH